MDNHDMPRREGVCLLLGAGASYDAALPTSCQLLREFKEYLKHDQEDGTTYCDRPAKPWWPAPKDPDMVRLIESLRPKDIEDLMLKLETRVPKEMSDEASEYWKIYWSAIRFINWRLRTPSVETIQYFKHLTDFLPFTNQTPLVIATLNWDCTVERSLGWQNISTGFEVRNQRIWTNGTFNPDRKIWLIKLHGSLSWVDYSWRVIDPQLPYGYDIYDAIDETTGSRFNKVSEISLWTHEMRWDQARKRFASPIRTPIPLPRVIIFGSKKLKSYQHSFAMFPVLGNHFANTLAKKKILISIGFSWHDTWVCKLIRESETNGLRVIDIKPSARRKNPWLTSSGRIRVPCGARAALENFHDILFPLLRKYME
jgi:hypothetical protein